ncbi:MAG: fumarate hydratase [Endomicrobiia bacterium]
MRKIFKEEFIASIKNLISQTNYFLPEDVLQEIKNCILQETNEIAKDVLYKILENAGISSSTKLPLCQDTGIPQFFLKIGKNICFDFNPEEVLKEITIQVYEKEKFRKSCVFDPIFRKPVSHCAAVYTEFYDEEEKCEVSLLIRGGGSENTFYTTTFLPTTDMTKIVEKIIEVVLKMLPYTCPPAVVGVGIGGSVEQSLIIAKKSLLRKIGERNKNTIYAEIEKQIKKQINLSQIGPLGLGGETSLLDVFIETAPTHIATLPVSIILQCHSYRRGSVII